MVLPVHNLTILAVASLSLFLEGCFPAAPSPKEPTRTTPSSASPPKTTQRPAAPPGLRKGPAEPGLATDDAVSAVGPFAPRNEASGVDPVEALRQCSQRQNKCHAAVGAAYAVKALQRDLQEEEEELREVREDVDLQEEVPHIERKISGLKPKITESKEALQVAIQECHADILEFSPAACTPSLYEDILKQQQQLERHSEELLSENRPSPKEPATMPAPPPTPVSTVADDEVSANDTDNKVSGVDPVEVQKTSCSGPGRICFKDGSNCCTTNPNKGFDCYVGGNGEECECK